jgi:hypothetical protein
LPPLKYVS